MICLINTDPPGRIIDDKTIQTIQGADIMVIPAHSTAGNIEGFTRTVALVKENSYCSILLVVNCEKRFSTIQSFMRLPDKFIAK